jgi:dihydropyrimidinase
MTPPDGKHRPTSGNLLIEGGTVITATDEYEADILVEDGLIAAIGVDLSAETDDVIDARGRYVIPGAVDPHTHTQTLVSGVVQVDDFTSVTTAAAFGGTTTMVDFVFQYPGESFNEAIDNWHAKLAGKPVIDVGFHLAITDLAGGGSLNDLARVPERGVTSYKLFMAYKGAFMIDDHTLFQTMRVASQTETLVMVHAENGDAIDVLVHEALEAGHTSPRYHGLTRPPETEGEATNRAIQLAHVAGCRLYVVHVSCREALEPIAKAREQGWDVWGETCTQYLFIDSSYLDLPDFESAKYVFTPPPRSKEDQEALWRGLRGDTLSILSSDHAPFSWQGQKTLGKDDFSKIPNGAPGIENRMHMLHEFGVRTGRISLNRMVELLSTNPAKLFGLYPKKGTLAVGSDADIVVFDPTKRLTLSADTHHSRIDYNLYEGTEVTGAPEVVLVRGNVVVQGDQLLAAPGSGAFVERARIGQRLTNSPKRDAAAVG